MKAAAEFGQQCIQDECENAYVHASVHKLALEKGKKGKQPA